MKAKKATLLIPYPKQIEFEDGFLSLAKTPKVAGLKPLKQTFIKTLQNELGKFTLSDKNKAQIIFHPTAKTPTKLKSFASKDEGYALTIDSSSANIYAKTKAGYLYGAMTLRQLIQQYGTKIPCMKIADEPSLPHRGVQLSFPQGHTSYRHSFMRNLVPELARWKINAIYLYLESYFDFPSLPNTAGPGAMTAEEAIDLDKLCLAYNIKLIPQLNVMAHSGEILSLQKYSHLKEYVPDQDPRTMNGFNLCASSSEVKKLVNTMLKDIFKCFSSEIIHIGGDEVSILGKCPECAKKKGDKTNFEFYSEYFGRIRDVAVKNGRKVGIWGDMLLHNCNPAKTEVQRKMLASLRDGVVIYDWHYSGGSPETLKFFVKHGFETIACASSHLCYSSAMWPYQSGSQKLLFEDAINAGTAGAMTTAWCNFCGLHEEHLNYLFSTGAAVLWSGAGDKTLVPGLSNKDFEAAYCLQRYGLNTSNLMKYLHFLGDGSEPLLKSLEPMNGVNIRKCLYHTDNFLTFWKQYAYILRGDGIKTYRAAVLKARKLWKTVDLEKKKCKDPYLHLLEGPLLTHEHLLSRFEMTEKLFDLYDKASKKQFDSPKEFSNLMKKASATLLGHLKDFPVIEKYLVEARKALGLDRSSILRVQATKKNIKHLADYLLHLEKGQRPLPAFIQFYGNFLTQARANWYGDREHEWAEEPPRFQRYTIEAGPWYCEVPDASREPGAHLAVTDFMLSPVKPFDGDLENLSLPADKKKLKLKKHHFSATNCSVHEHFKNGVSQIVYYACPISCSETMNLEIGLGYDGPIKVWFDGKNVFQDPDGINPSIAEELKLPFKAKKGKHEIIVALSSNCGKAFGIFFQISRKDIKFNPNVEPVLPVIDL